MAGRPKTDKPRTVLFKVRLTEEELAQVKRAAGSVPAARFVRETLMKAIKEENTNG